MAGLGDGLNFKYEPIWPQAPVDESFHYYETSEDGTQILKIKSGMTHLITTLEELETFIEKMKGKLVAFDTETTGLSYGKDKIVGFSFSLDSYSGYYVPIRHQLRVGTSSKIDKLDENGNQVLTKSGKPSKTTVTTYEYFDREENLDPKKALSIIYEALCGAKTVLMHNSEFDLNMLKFEGLDVTKIPAFDTLILPYVFDPEATNLAGLKALEKRVLGRTVPEFKDVLGKEAENFAFVKPEDGYEYACYDKETEVLTDVGWVKWPEYSGRDLLLTFNVDTEELEYQFPSVLYKYRFKGNMECCKGSLIDYCVTPNHNMLVYKEGTWVLQRADKLLSNETMLVLENGRPTKISTATSNKYQSSYNDYVYCAEVPNHTLVTRRNGKVLVAGNCYDTMGTYGIFQKMYPVVKDLLAQFKEPLSFNGKEYKILGKDNAMVMSFVDYYGHAKILIDKEKATTYKQQLIKRRDEVIKKIYDFFGKPFNLSTSSLEFKKVMASKKVYTGIKTDKGGDSWGKPAAAEMKKSLAKIKEGLQHWREISYIKGAKTGVLSKKGTLAFNFATSLNIYGKYHFKMKDNVDTLSVRSLNGAVLDLVDFWKAVQKVYKEEMEKLNVLSLIHENNSLNKALNSYVDKLTQVDECCMKYRLKGTKSGRLSSGNGSKSDKKRNTYYIDLNAQNLTKPASAYYSAEECPIDDPEGILGWKFTPLAKDYAMEHLEDLYIVEGQDPNITIRGCLKAPEGRYVVSLDYDAEEYRLICILSGDSQMRSNFLNGIDPHTASAYAIWGEENYDKAKRKKAKIFNFLNNYSGGAHTLAQQLDISVNEAQNMINKYNETFWEMVQWKQREIDKMYANDGVVFNAFGRPRQFKGWINVISKCLTSNYETLVEKRNISSASERVKAAVERRVSSHEVQGTAGDILRLVMLDLYQKYFKNRDPHIDFMSTVHDEVNYTIDKEVTVDYVRDLEDIMTFDKLDPELPVKTSTDIGYTYGNMFPFVWTDDMRTKLIPKRVHHA